MLGIGEFSIIDSESHVRKLFEEPGEPENRNACP